MRQRSFDQRVFAAFSFGTDDEVSMNESYRFEYRMHAYQDGNFRELKVERSLSWAQLLAILGNTFIHPTPEEYFSKRMNEYLNETGLDDARQIMPRAHAVARAQINIRALHEIKMQMRQNDWIVQAGRDDRQRMLWQTTAKAQKLLESNLLDTDRVNSFKTPY